MLANALEFLCDTLLGLLSILFLLRCYLQLTGAPFHNPFSQSVIALTNFAVRRVRRIIPAIGWLDTASLLLAFLTQLILQLIILWLRDFPLLVADPQVFIALFGLAGIGIIKLTLYLLLYAVIIQAVLSWINPHTPLTSVLDSLTRPILRPLRRYLPATAGIDLGKTRVWMSRATSSSRSIRRFSTISSSSLMRWIATAQVAARALDTGTSASPNGPPRLLRTWRTPTSVSSWPIRGMVRSERVRNPVSTST